MTSRRIISSDKTLFDRDDEPNTPKATEGSVITPAVPAAVIVKLLGFTLAMIAGPIGTYFLTLNTVFGGPSYAFCTTPSVEGTYSYNNVGNSTWAGGTAAFIANMVLIAYVIVAMREDQSEKLAAEEKARKGE